MSANHHTLATLTEVIEVLRAKGYTEDFNLKANSLHCGHCGTELQPDEFEIDATYRFEGTSNPSDEEIVYAISSRNHDVKGILVNGYGIYSEPLVGKMAEKLEIVGRDNALTS